MVATTVGKAGIPRVSMNYHRNTLHKFNLSARHVTVYQVRASTTFHTSARSFNGSRITCTAAESLPDVFSDNLKLPFAIPSLPEQDTYTSEVVIS